MAGVILTQLGDHHCGDWLLISLLIYFQHQPLMLLDTGTWEALQTALGELAGSGGPRPCDGSLEKIAQGILQRISLVWNKGLNVLASTQICQVLGSLGAASFSLPGWLCLMPRCWPLFFFSLFLLCPSPLINCFRQSWSKRFYSKLIFLAAELGSIKEKCK